MSRFEFGIGVREITPDAGHELWGYTDRSGPATGTLDPLFAKVMIFGCDMKRVAWVVFDLGRVPMAPERDAIRTEALKLGIEAVVFHATHTHHGPRVETLAKDVVDMLVGRVGEAMAEAMESLQAAKVGYGTCTIDIAHNRRIIGKDGLCRMLWRNETQTPTSPIDPEATVIKIESESGDPLAVLVHFACHPVVMGPSNLGYSADYVGTLTRIVKGMTDAECVFLQGACGDINPYLDKTSIDEGGIDAAFSAGRIAGEAVTGAVFGMVTAVPVQPEVALYQSRVEVGVRWDMGDESQRGALRKSQGALFGRYMDGLGDELSVPMSVLMVNREVALVGMPGEFFIEQQIALKALGPVAHTLLCGYVDDYHAYFPPIAQAAAGGYGGSVGTYVGLGAAERLYAEGLMGIYTLLGRFNDRYEASDFLIRKV